MINSTILSHLVSTRYGAGKGSLSCVLSLLKRYWISLPVPETWLSPCTKAATRPYRRCRHLVRHDGSGTEKVAAAGYSEHISFEQQDCTALTYEENSFDAVTAAFGVRNFENIEQGISEMYRVLKPGGHIMILELSTPEHFPMRQLYQIYSKTVIPFIGRLLSKEKVAYNYLPASIKVVPQGKVMTDLLTRQGFKQARVRTFTFGICSLYTGSKE